MTTNAALDAGGLFNVYSGCNQAGAGIGAATQETNNT